MSRENWINRIIEDAFFQIPRRRSLAGKDKGLVGAVTPESAVGEPVRAAGWER